MGGAVDDSMQFSEVLDGILDIETDPSIGTTDAVAADILAPKKVVSQGKLLTGTMANRGAVNQSLTTNNQEYTISTGFHNGLGKIKAVITGLAANVIKSGTTVGGVLGTFTNDATATAAQMLSGSIAYVKGNKVTGTMPKRGAPAVTLTTQGGQHNLAAGYYSGGNIKAQFANLTPLVFLIYN